MQMQNERKKLEELNLLDDFLFNAMMTYPEMGEKFTRKMLKLLFNKDFRNLKVIAQKSYGGLNTDLRGARLDVYVESDDSAGRSGGVAPPVGMKEYLTEKESREKRFEVGGRVPTLVVLEKYANTLGKHIEIRSGDY